MAQAQTLKFSQFLIEVAAAPFPDVNYGAPCGLNSRSNVRPVGALSM